MELGEQTGDEHRESGAQTGDEHRESGAQTGDDRLDAHISDRPFMQALSCTYLNLRGKCTESTSKRLD